MAVLEWPKIHQAFGECVLETPPPTHTTPLDGSVKRIKRGTGSFMYWNKRDVHAIIILV